MGAGFQRNGCRKGFALIRQLADYNRQWLLSIKWRLLLGRRTKVDDNDEVVANAAQALEYLSERSNNHVVGCYTTSTLMLLIILGNARYSIVAVLQQQYSPTSVIHRVSEKNWTLCYFVISLLWQLRIAWKFPEVYSRCCLFWIWNKCLWFFRYSLLITLKRNENYHMHKHKTILMWH